MAYLKYIKIFNKISSAQFVGATEYVISISVAG